MREYEKILPTTIIPTDCDGFVVETKDPYIMDNFIVLMKELCAEAVDRDDYEEVLKLSKIVVDAEFIKRKIDFGNSVTNYKKIGV